MMSTTTTLSIVKGQGVDTESVERRSEPRHEAAYRPCCIIKSERVTMGLIRNFSAGGARIETQAELEIGDEFHYFWEENSRMSAKVIWREGMAYGVEHISSRAQKPNQDFPTRSVRVPCRAEAICWVADQIHTAFVENISLGGMRLRGLPEVTEGSLLTVSFCGLELHAASVRWVGQGSAGVRFSQSLTREMLAELLLNQHFHLNCVEFSKAMPVVARSSDTRAAKHGGLAQ